MPAVSESELENILYRCGHKDSHERGPAKEQLRQLVESESLRRKNDGGFLPLSGVVESTGIMDILLEAARCIQCENRSCQLGKTGSGPNSGGCPLGLRIPEFIDAIRQGDIRTAHQILMDDNPLHWVTARVCAQDAQCQASCALNELGAVSIGQLERAVGELYRKLFGPADDCLGWLPGAKDFPIAIIGSGPAGLAAAIFLARRDYSRIYIFDALHQPGGILRYGTTPYRLPDQTLDEIVRYVEGLGVKIINDVVVGQTLTLDDLQQMGFRAFYLEASEKITVQNSRTGATDMEGVFFGSAGTAAFAMGDGKKTAAKIDRYLNNLSEDATTITVDPQINRING